MSIQAPMISYIKAFLNKSQHSTFHALGVFLTCDKHWFIDTVMIFYGHKHITHNTDQKNTTIKSFICFYKSLSESITLFSWKWISYIQHRKGNRIKLKLNYPHTWLLHHSFGSNHHIPSYDPVSLIMLELGLIFNKCQSVITIRTRLG